jgi:hypothetical protein
MNFIGCPQPGHSGGGGAPVDMARNTSGPATNPIQEISLSAGGAAERPAAAAPDEQETGGVGR